MRPIFMNCRNSLPGKRPIFMNWRDCLPGKRPIFASGKCLRWFHLIRTLVNYRKRNFIISCISCLVWQLFSIDCFFEESHLSPSISSSLLKPHRPLNLIADQTSSGRPQWKAVPWSMRLMRNFSTTTKESTTTPQLRESVGTAVRYSSSRDVVTSRIACQSAVNASTSNADVTKGNRTLAVAALSLLVSLQIVTAFAALYNFNL